MKSPKMKLPIPVNNTRISIRYKGLIPALCELRGWGLLCKLGAVAGQNVSIFYWLVLIDAGDTYNARD